MAKFLDIVNKSRILEIIKILIGSAVLAALWASSIRADDLNIQLLRDIEFRNGFGQIEAKPILKDVNKDIKVMGEFNVEEKSGNVEMKIDKVLYGGKIYTLSESFNTKRRLKNPKTAKLAKSNKLKLSGGSHPEILSILNGEASPSGSDSKNGANGKDGSGGTNTNNSASARSQDSNSSSGSYGGRYSSGSSNNGNSNYPYYPPYNSGSSNNGGSSGNGGSTGGATDSNGNCKAPEIKDGMAYVYPRINGICTQKVVSASAVQKKQNTSTCPNKTDYDKLKVSIGEESYAVIDDTEYRIESCQYKGEEAQLQLTRESCTAIPDFESKIARIQKQYWYQFQNDKINVGSCIPTGETTPIFDDDYNACEYQLDFENAKATKQTQWYYYVENEKVSLGECVNVSENKLASMTYPMYETSQGCECQEIDGMNFCKTKLVFNGFNNQKIDATECRYIDTEGMGLQEEFAGYEYHDTSKFALRKVNQFLIGVGGEKIYVTKGKTTNKSFPYKTESCGWEHHDPATDGSINNGNGLDLSNGGFSYHKSKVTIYNDYDSEESIQNAVDNGWISFQEEDEGKNDIRAKRITGCEANTDMIFYWEQQLDLVKEKYTTTHERVVMIPKDLDSLNPNKWTMPQIKVSDKHNREVIAESEDGEIPIWSQNFKANNLNLTNTNWRSNGWFLRGYYWCNSHGNQVENEQGCYPAKSYIYINNLKLEGAENIPNYFSIGWEKVLDYGYDGTAIGISHFNNINNPFYPSDSKIKNVYQLELTQPITITPKSIEMNLNLIDQENPKNSDDENNKIFWKNEVKEIIDNNTGKCILEDCQINPKWQNEWSGWEHKTDKGEVIKKCLNPKFDPNKDTCKTQIVGIYTSGVTFTPKYDDITEEIPFMCKAGETQSLINVQNNSYEAREPNEEEINENNNGKYFKYIEEIKGESLNVKNYSKVIDKVSCSSGEETTDANQSAYIAGAIINKYTNYNFNKREVDSLAGISLRADYERNLKYKNSKTQSKYFTRERLYTTFDTKKNWANNQTIEEWEMWRVFKKPDGSIFKLYERQGFFVEPNGSGSSKASKASVNSNVTNTNKSSNASKTDKNLEAQKLLLKNLRNNTK